MRFKMTIIYSLSKRLFVLSFVAIRSLYKSSIRLLMPSFIESIRLLIVTSSPFTSRISLCMRSSSLKRKAKGSALYTISSFFSVSGAIAESYLRGLPDVKKNKKGMTLVEVMIALVVLLFVSLAMMQTALLSIDSNMINILRDEAVSIAEMSMDEARNTAFDNLIAGTTTTPVQRNIRNIRDFEYTVTRSVTGSGDTRQVVITVTWNWKGNLYTHSITSIVRR